MSHLTFNSLVKHYYQTYANVIEEALQLHAVYQKPYFLYYMQVTQESIPVLQVTREPYIIIITIVRSYTQKYHSFIAFGIVTHALVTI